MPRPPVKARPRRSAAAAAGSGASSADGGGSERIQKVLAQAGLASRREAEDWIRAGRVSVNGVVVDIGAKVSGRDELRVDGRVVRRSRDPSRLGAEATVFLCHRSSGESLAEGLLARLPRRTGRRFLAVSPMPRIDGGLELVTTDGALAERLQRRVRHWPAEFLVRVRGEMDELHLENLRRGELDDGRQLEGVEVEGSEVELGGSNRWYRLSAVGASGKDVRRLFERHGALVSRVQRTALGPLALTRDLNRGHFRALGADEARLLAAEAKKAPQAESDEVRTPVR
jgi:23S rRNA pseudouridine2605 synthase